MLAVFSGYIILWTLYEHSTHSIHVYNRSVKRYDIVIFTMYTTANTPLGFEYMTK